MQAAFACALDRCLEERRTHAAPAPFARDQHAYLAKTERCLLDVQPADDVVASDCGQRPVERLGSSAGVDVHGRLRSDSVALLCHRGEQNR